MKQFRVATGLTGSFCLQARRKFLPFLWRTFALSANREQLELLRDKLNAPD